MDYCKDSVEMVLNQLDETIQTKVNFLYTAGVKNISFNQSHTFFHKEEELEKSVK